MADEPLTGTAGQRLFARYAYAPNHLGYCGPADSAALAELASTGRTTGDVLLIASRFSGAWPYLCVLAELAGIADPLDERVVRAYWTGSALLDEVDRPQFWRKLLDRIAAAGAGRYWAHLTPALLSEAMPTHGFHVFGVYPWTRLLTAAPAGPGPALHVLDSCRIRWARVISVEADCALVRGRRLAWDGHALRLGKEGEDSVRLTEAGRAFVADVSPGDWLAVHWDLACERLAVEELWRLRRWTDWQLTATNVRLARETDRARHPHQEHLGGSQDLQKLPGSSEAAYMRRAGADQFRFAHSGP
jgi:hypothetical protein